jgi:enediyne biosynthesis protein E4
VSNIGPNMLYRNRAGAGFTNVAQGAGVTHTIENVHNMLNPSMDWGINFADFNNDGWLDLYMVQGSMYFENLPQPNRLFLNDHSGAFIDVSDESGANDPGQGRSVAVADYDGDGYLDLAVANYGQPLLLYRNLSAHSGNNWVRLELEGTRSNRDAVGARVRLFAPGLQPQTREVQIGQGLGSCDAKALHFGLGGSERVDRIEIRWPSGQMQIIRDIAGNRVLPVREPGISRWSHLD